MSWTAAGARDVTVDTAVHVRDRSTADSLMALGGIVLSVGAGAVWWPLGLLTAGTLLFAVGAIASWAGK